MKKCLFLILLIQASSSLNDFSKNKVLKQVFQGSWSSETAFLTYSEKSGTIQFFFSKSQNNNKKWIGEFEISNSQNSRKETLFLSNLFYKKKSITFNSTLMISNYISCQSEGNILFTKEGSKGYIFAKDCAVNINFTAQAMEGSKFEKARVVYSFILFSICFLNSFIAARFQDICAACESTAQKTSFWLWFMNGIIDYTIFMLNFQEIIRDQTSLESMMMSIMWSLISFYAIRTKLLFIVFRSHYEHLSISSAYNLFSRKIALMCILYLDLIGIPANLIVYQFQFLYFAIIPFLISFFIPQILKTVYANVPSPIPPYICVCIAVSRISLLVR